MEIFVKNSLILKWLYLLNHLTDFDTLTSGWKLLMSSFTQALQPALSDNTEEAVGIEARETTKPIIPLCTLCRIPSICPLYQYIKRSIEIDTEATVTSDIDLKASNYLQYKE